MKTELTKQDILDLFEKQTKNFEMLLLKEQLEREKSRIEFDKKLEKSQERFDKELGKLGGTWGRFVAEMVKPKIVEMFKERGIKIKTSLQNVEGFVNDQRHYEVDLLLINNEYAVAVEIKSSLSVDDVKEHLDRLNKIKTIPPERVNLSGVTVFGAVAAMLVEGDADKYAYRQGLFVLRQKGNIVEIVNDDKFKPKEWKTEY